MKRPTLVAAEALGILIPALMMSGFGSEGSDSDGSKASLEPRTLPAIVARLDLGKVQELRFHQIVEREAGRVDQLEQALIANEQKLREAEISRPFDARRVNRWIVREAEVLAYLRGTESRVVSEIVELLTPEEQARFSRLRAAASATRLEPSTRKARSAAGKPSWGSSRIPPRKIPAPTGPGRAEGTWSLARSAARMREAAFAAEDSN